MKIKFWTIYVAMIATSLLAQDTNTPATAAVPVATAPADAAPATNTPAPAPAIETPAPAPAVTTMPEVKPEPAKAPAPAKKKVVKKKPAPELKTVPLVPGPAVVSATRVNVRGQAGLKGEVLTRLTNGEPVTVLEEIRLKRSAPEEPSVWAKIALPAKMRVWVHASYVDKAAKTVKAKTLNLRGGSGENFSVLGTLKRGDAVKEIEIKGDWMQIEAPANSYAFVAAQYLSQERALLAAAGSPGMPAMSEMETNPIVGSTTVVDNPVVATTSTELATGATNEMAAGSTNEVAAVEEPLPPRIVSHEGVVRSSISIQAPTAYELIHPETRKLINYLYTTSPNLDLSRYKGLRIVVTGEEGLDERWRNTPVITIQRILVIE